MPHAQLTRIVRLIERRRARRARQQRSASRRVQIWAALLLGALSLALATAMLVAPQALQSLTAGLPPLESIPLLLDSEAGALLQPTTLYDRNGQEIGRLEAEGLARQFIDLDPESPLAQALLAQFDPDYWQQPLFSLEAFSAPPSIAEQLVADFLYSGKDSGWLQSLRARLLAAQLSEAFGRPQVLSWYANSRVFSHGAVGVEAAAQLYFGRPANQLSLAQAALLAPVAQAPALNPVDAPQLAIQRQQALLLEILDQGLANQEAVTAALVEPLEFQEAPAMASSAAPAFSQLALEAAQQQLGYSAVQRGGLDLHTPLDLGLQSALEELVAGADGAQAVVMDPASGDLLAFVGQAEQAQAAPGSALNPFIYLNAFARGQAPASLAWDAPVPLLDELDGYTQGAAGYQGPVNLRAALANDYPAVSLQLLDQVGTENAWEAARQAGLSAWQGQGLDALLQGPPASALQLAQSYATLANLGAQPAGSPTLTTLIGPRGESLWSDEGNAGRQVFAPELAYLVTDVLADVGARLAPEEHQALSEVGRPAALVVAHDPEQNGSWVIGYSPQRVLALWWPAAEGALQTWAQAFQLAHAGLPIQNWEAPAGLASTVVCVPAGGLPSADCPETRRELFLAGDQPTAADSLYQRVAVNSQSERLATVFSPGEFIEERLVLQVPAELEEWARSAGLPVAPRDYDSVLLASASQAEVRITSPAPFSQAEDAVMIEGSTGSEVGLSYRVLVGQGLYPQAWTEIAAGQEPVVEGLLARWQAGELSGAYAIQLQVFYPDGSLQRAYSLVSFDP